MCDTGISDEGFYHNDPYLSGCCRFLLPMLLRMLRKESASLAKPVRVFDLGCGNGSAAHAVAMCGYHVTGVDPSVKSIGLGQKAYPDLDLQIGSAYDPLAEKFGRFPIVYSLEVVEHLYFPRKYAACLFDLVEPGGLAIVSTPYHGYLKNLAIALTGKMDKHFSALWDHGHIKFWSQRTLRELLHGAGFTKVRFLRVGML